MEYLNLYKHLKKFIDSENEIIIDISENYPGLRFDINNKSGINLMIALADLSYVINHANQLKYANLLSQFRYNLFLDLKFLNNELKCNEFIDNIINQIPNNIQDYLLEFKNKIIPRTNYRTLIIVI
ncbi:hypothetical protein MIMI_R13 [Acanthamoeba polyphaga mimivirus]|uniref:Uncharacterized protein R13 n=1 Tax=Acanthamoeba polyphaga mimivirus TaxID=212035 RepID=F8V4Y0_MIMIV|nr:hypothetical protein MIMI_R13 [Acanthamoeba polyphaga mimivirus]